MHNLLLYFLIYYYFIFEEGVRLFLACPPPPPPTYLPLHPFTPLPPFLLAAAVAPPSRAACLWTRLLGDALVYGRAARAARRAAGGGVGTRRLCVGEGEGGGGGVVSN